MTNDQSSRNERLLRSALANLLYAIDVVGVEHWDTDHTTPEVDCVINASQAARDILEVTES